MRRHAVALAVAAALIVTAPGASIVRTQTPARDPATPQPPPTGSSSISGLVVVEGPTPSPLRRATVTLSSRAPSLLRTAVTDDAGRFRVESLPAGRFTMTASKAGYVTTRDVPTPAPTVTVDENQHVTDVTLRLARGAVITGRVVDHHGRPVASAGIAVAVRRHVGRLVTTRLVTSPGGPGGLRTDDRGIYRAFGLPAGTYVIGVTPPPAAGAAIASAAELQWARQGRTAPVGPAPPHAPAVTHAAVYFPGTPDLADATAVTVAAGEERTGVDVAFGLMPTTEITGLVTWPDGQPAAGAQIMAAAQARPIVAAGVSGPTRVPPTGTDGRFAVTGLIPGTYTIMARAPRPADRGPDAGRGAAISSVGPAGGGRVFTVAPVPLHWAVADIRADGQRIDDLGLVLRPGLTVTGRLVFEGSSVQPSATDLSRALIALATAPEFAATLRVSARGARPDGTFELEGLIPGEYVLTSSLTIPKGPRWLLKSATAGGRDVLDTPLEIRPNTTITDLVVTFTDQLTEISGRITDQQGRPVPELWVVAFSTDWTQWRQGSRWLGSPRRPNSEGLYTFTGLPPGEYYLAALPEYDQMIWYTPEYLDQIVPGAIKVTLGEGEKKTQDFRVGQ